LNIIKRRNPLAHSAVHKTAGGARGTNTRLRRAAAGVPASTKSPERAENGTHKPRKLFSHCRADGASTHGLEKIRRGACCVYVNGWANCYANESLTRQRAFECLFESESAYTRFLRLRAKSSTAHFQYETRFSLDLKLREAFAINDRRTW
jgi:hypothetical protein